MLLKKFKRTNFSNTKAAMIGGLVDYILGKKDENGMEKRKYAYGFNFVARTSEAWKQEMIALSQETIRSKMPVAHWVMSWKEKEKPTKEQVIEATEIFLDRMGLKGHQAIVAAHVNTSNFHVHIAVNRVHPLTEQVVQPHNGFDIEAAHRIVAEIEYRQGWANETRARYRVDENKRIVRNRRPREVRPRAEAEDFEHATGEKSAQRIAQERGHTIMENARSWVELHEKLAGVGLRFEKKGSGAIVWVGDTAVKASSVDRAFSMKKLCARLGEFEVGNYPKTQECIAPEPVSPVNHVEWKAYQVEREKTGKRPPDREAASMTADLKERQKQERKEKLARLAPYGLPIMNIARHCLCLQQRQEMRDLRRKLKRPRKTEGRLCFETWLRSHGMDTQAENWRHRKRLEEARHAPPPVQSRDFSGKNEQSLFRRYAIAVNAAFYRVTCTKMQSNGERKTYVLGNKDGTGHAFSPDELMAQIPELLRLQEQGENIYYTPLSEDKHHILIDNMTENSLERLQRKGYKPAVILQGSPGNFQCLLTIPRLGTEFDREVANKITERLNKEFGDKSMCNSLHPHPALGFENRKHRQKDGTYPQVKLVFAERRQCAKTLELAKWIDLECRQTARERQKSRPMPSAALRPGDSSRAYYAHFDNISRNITIDDYSRVDAMIALRMRANGHSRETVAETIRTCAPTIRENPKGRDWQRYAERTADYAFGMDGDQDMARNQRFLALWRKIEGIDERQREEERSIFRMG